MRLEFRCQTTEIVRRPHHHQIDGPKSTETDLRELGKQSIDALELKGVAVSYEPWQGLWRE